MGLNDEGLFHLVHTYPVASVGQGVRAAHAGGRIHKRSVTQCRCALAPAWVSCFVVVNLGVSAYGLYRARSLTLNPRVPRRPKTTAARPG